MPTSQMLNESIRPNDVDRGPVWNGLISKNEDASLGRIKGDGLSCKQP